MASNVDCDQRRDVGDCETVPRDELVSVQLATDSERYEPSSSSNTSSTASSSASPLRQKGE
jgi:hypothetical protein